MKPYDFQLNPTLDLQLQRIVPVPRALVWKAWTDPEHIKKWFCPRPWMTTECEMDLRPGGKFYTAMKGPNGEYHANTGCFLEVFPLQRLTFTSALETGFRPLARIPNEKGDCTDLSFTAFVDFEDAPGGGTKYTATAAHNDEAGRKTHAEMGFDQGWGTALDQLVAEIQSGSIS
ncbi:MAG: SRPBCC family protein [Alphaproteobacteria bacterium]|nr:SRPBCC family protein [Alphaproteobacteria bacterium]